MRPRNMGAAARCGTRKTSSLLEVIMRLFTCTSLAIFFLILPLTEFLIAAEAQPQKVVADVEGLR